MAVWSIFPASVPVHNQLCYIRVNSYYGAPFLASYSSTLQGFTSSANSIFFPAWSCCRWKSAALDELITNGGFLTDTDWSKGAEWGIADNKATYTAGEYSTIGQYVNLTQGRTYRISFDIVEASGDCVFGILNSDYTDMFGSPLTSPITPVAGSYSYDLVCLETTDYFMVYGQGTTGSFSITNISLFAL